MNATGETPRKRWCWHNATSFAGSQTNGSRRDAARDRGWHRSSAQRDGQISGELSLSRKGCPVAIVGGLSGAQHVAAAVSPDLQRLLGYSIHPPFIGAVNGMHPVRLLHDD